MASLNRTLISVGFTDLEGAQRFLEANELRWIDQAELLNELRVCANPDLALRSLVWILASSDEARKQIQRIVNTGAEPRERLFRILGASEALGEFLARNPQWLDEFLAGVSAEPTTRSPGFWREALLTAVGADPAAETPYSELSYELAVPALRVAYRGGLLQLAIADLSAASPTDAMPTIAAGLSDLAAAALEAALATSRSLAKEHFSASDVAGTRMCVIGMGKAGARELNYISDVDVMYVVQAFGPGDERVTEIGSFLATNVAKILNGTLPSQSLLKEPALFEVDPNLRPEGKDGPLVRTVESYVEYYQRWAHNWEFQALLKARAMAGDLHVGQLWHEAIEPMVWRSSEREGFVASVQRMRQRVSQLISEGEKDRQLKLGAGGLRDVEFTVQLLQLVHGKSDPSVRVPDTIHALAALAAGGYIGRDDAAALDASYRFLRVLEHRVQLVHLRRTHLMPTKDAQLRALAKASEGALNLNRPSAEDLDHRWRAVKRKVRTLHESIFYRPLLNSVATWSADEARLSAEAAQARLAALGYVDPQAGLRHIEALTSGLSRRAALQRQILPAMLDWLAQGVDPDAGLLRFRRLSDTLGSTHWYLGMLRDSPAAAERLCKILTGTRVVADLLEVSPEQTAWLGDDSALQPRSFESLWTEIKALIDRGSENSIRQVRVVRRREILRIALAEGLELTSAVEAAHALSDNDRATILGALRLAEREQDAPLLTDVVVVGMGRLGGRENSYGSDADVMYVHQPRAGVDMEAAQAQAQTIVSRLVGLISAPVKPAIITERVLSIDADLRPEGKRGPLVRTIDSFAEYYQKWAEPWEFQALVRARPIAGNDVVAEAFVTLIDRYRYPKGGLSESDIRHIRRLKARMEAERLPRGADPARHLKMGRGGLADVEWLTQLYQLNYAFEFPQLKTTSTLAALTGIKEAGLIPTNEVDILAHAWRLTSQLRAAVVICTGKTTDVLPGVGKELEAVARWCGYAPGSAALVEEEYLRVSRQARGLCEKYFYDFSQ